jgi:glycosyltransferase involved in cell wall biosynthesis
VVGGGPSLAAWRIQAKKLGLEKQVEFLGPQPKEALPQFYREADLFVFPALRDSGGSALLEAMEQGVPVLCFPWGGPAEMVSERTGFLVEVQSPAETIRGMAGVMTGLRENPNSGRHKAEEARLWARHQFSWHRKGELLAQTYREILLQP